MQHDLVSLIQDPKPWVGSHFSEQPSILVMGESHKMEGQEPAPTSGTDFAGYTIRSVEWRVRGGPSPFFANVEKTMVDESSRLHVPGNEAAETAARSDFWNSVAFANFVPSIMASQQNRPTRQQWMAGSPRFIKLINALEPDLVCLFSRTAFNGDYIPWGEAPNFDGLGREPSPVPDEPDLYLYPLAGGGTTRVAIFNHASRAAVDPARDRFMRIREQLRGHAENLN